jgi:hypothetical protein
MDVAAASAPPGSAADQEPLREPFRTFDDFLDPAEARELRSHYDVHFARPHGHKPDTHQVWNYWYVPELYTYLRTDPAKVIPRPLVQRFHERLSLWAMETLGLGLVTWPNLSLYVDGCVQHLHNDSTNGRFGFVYSLTRDERRSIGGETLVLREGDLFRTQLTRDGAGPAMHNLIAPAFNRLTIFDDRMPHGVRLVEGGMDPVDGRVVLHGHISENGPAVRGPLALDAVAAAAAEATAPALAQAGDAHGPLTLHLAIAADGSVSEVRPLVDRVVRPGGGAADDLVGAILRAVRALRLPEAPWPSEAWLPIMVGGPLPWMEKAPPAGAAAAAPLASTPAPRPALAPEPAPRPSAPPEPPAFAAPLSPTAEAAAAVRARLRNTLGVSPIPKERLEIYVVHQFLTPAEIAALLADADGARAACEARIDALLGLAPDRAEPSLLETVGPEGLPPALDAFDPDTAEGWRALAAGGQRSWTVLAFLETPEPGGEVLFPNAEFRVTPAAGYLLVWNNQCADGSPNGFAVHETTPAPAAPQRRLVRRYREPPRSLLEL